MKVTKRKLQSMGACAEHVELFAATFPKGTYVTLESLAKAREVGLDIGWFAGHVPDDRYEKYDHIMQSARDEYNRIRQPAWDEYARITQAAQEEFERTTQPSWEEFERIEQSAVDEYKKARYIALVTAFAD